MNINHKLVLAFCQPNAVRHLKGYMNASFKSHLFQTLVITKLASILTLLECFTKWASAGMIVVTSD